MWFAQFFTCPWGTAVAKSVRVIWQSTKEWWMTMWNKKKSTNKWIKKTLRLEDPSKGPELRRCLPARHRHRHRHRHRQEIKVQPPTDFVTHFDSLLTIFVRSVSEVTQLEATTSWWPVWFLQEQNCTSNYISFRSNNNSTCAECASFNSCFVGTCHRSCSCFKKFRLPYQPCCASFEPLRNGMACPWGGTFLEDGTSAESGT